MKYFFTTLLLISTSIACTAQIEQFTFAISSSFSFSKANSEAFDGITNQKYISKNVNLQPKVGFFVLKRLCVGAHVPIVLDKIEHQGFYHYDGSGRGIGFGPFVRYYQPFAKNLYGILGLGYSWNKRSMEYDTFDPNSGDQWHDKVETETTQFQKSMGLSYFINRNIAIEMMLDHLKHEDIDDDPISVNSSQEGLTLSIGLQIYLTKNRE